MSRCFQAPAAVDRKKDLSISGRRYPSRWQQPVPTSEVTCLMSTPQWRSHLCWGLTPLSRKSLGNKFCVLVGLSSYCKCLTKQNAHIPGFGLSTIILNTQHSCFIFLSKAHRRAHTKSTWRCVYTVQSEAFQLWLVSLTPWRNEHNTDGWWGLKLLND